VSQMAAPKRQFAPSAPAREHQDHSPCSRNAKRKAVRRAHTWGHAGSRYRTAQQQHLRLARKDLGRRFDAAQVGRVACRQAPSGLV